MNLLSCKSPKYFYNKYTGDEGFAPCGKCYGCRSVRSAQWVARLEQERRCWKYAVFFTLTYADRFQARLTLDDYGNLVDMGRFQRVRTRKGYRTFKEDCGLVISAEDLALLNMKAPSRLYLETRREFDYIPPSDLQKFIKRVRKQSKCVCEQENETYPCIRYFMAVEYGPSTYRSHVHGILFFSSDAVARNIGTILSDCWLNSDYTTLEGYRVNFEFVTDGCSSYVASYCQGFADLPEFYTIRPFRPYVLCSRNPPIGLMSTRSDYIDYQRFLEDTKFVEFERCINTSFPQLFLPKLNPRTGVASVISVSLWRCIENQLYPKITGFCRLPFEHRVALYGIAFERPYESWSDFERWYFNNIEIECHGVGSFVRGIIDTLSLDNNGLKRVFYTSKRVWKICSANNFSLPYFVKVIDNYYSSKNYRALLNYFDVQRGFQVNELPSFVGVDLMFLTKLQRYSCLFDTPLRLPSWILTTLKSFGVDINRLKDDDYFKSLSYLENITFKMYWDELEARAKDSHKNRAKNEYINRHSELSYLNYKNYLQYEYTQTD